MAQRKTRAAARRGKAAARSKARTRTKPVRGKTAKSARARKPPAKRVTKAKSKTKSKRVVETRAAPVEVERREPSTTASMETVIAAIMKEPVSDSVAVVTGCEVTESREPEAIHHEHEESR